MFNTYYQDELRYLRESGREFAQAHPESTRFLGEAGADPDVERLLEGVAFLTGRIRQKLDDELPEVAQALIEQLWPQYLCPLPALTLLQVDHARAGDLDVHRLPAGSLVDSVPVDGTRCRFRTAAEVVVLPIRISEVVLRPGAHPVLEITVRCAAGTNCAQLAETGVPALRLHCVGAHAQAAGLHACLTRHARSIVAVASIDGMRREVTLHRGPARCPAMEEALLPGPGPHLPALARLAEFLAFPAKFLAAEIPGVAALAQLGACDSFTLHFDLAGLPGGIGAVSAGSLLLGCTPAANCFPHHADPVPLDPLSGIYRLRASGSPADHFEVHSVVSVEGLVRGRPTPRPYRLWTTARPGAPSDARTFAVRRRPSPLGWGAEILLDIPAALGCQDEETLAVAIWATNRRLPSALAPGDVSQLVGGSGKLRLRNLDRPTPCAWPPLGRDLEWRLVRLLALNHRSLAEVGSLRDLIELHHPRIHGDPQVRSAHHRFLEGIERVRCEPATRLHHGLPVRGSEVTVAVREDRFDGDGDRHLFTQVLDEVLAQHVALNSWIRLRVEGTITGAVLSQPPRSGRGHLI